MNKTETPMELSTIRKACGVRALRAYAVVMALVAVAAVVIDNHAILWGRLSFVLTLGGSFWGGAAVTILCAAVLGWSVCVSEKISDALGEDSPARKSSLNQAAALFVLYLMSFAAFMSMNTERPIDNSYEALAVLCAALPIIAIGCFALAVWYVAAVRGAE